MDYQEMADRYIDAWNRRSVADLLRLMTPDATYHDAFWGESCSGRDLVRYLDTSFKEDAGFYQQDEEIITTPSGFVFRYLSFDQQNPKRRKLRFKGVDVITLDHGLIAGVSDIYCDTDTVQLLEFATRIEKRRLESNVATLGLSAKTAGRIKRRLAELGENTTIFIDSSLTARRLADRVGCPVVHLIHVLETEKDTNFRQLVDGHRVSFATSLLLARPGASIDLEKIASLSGFKHVEDLDKGFQSILGMTAADYLRHSDQQSDCSHQEDSASQNIS